MARILSIDFGSKRVGLAISDPLGMIAQPFGFVPFSGQRNFTTALKKIVEEKRVELILLGLPKNMDGTLGGQAEDIMELSGVIRKACGIEVQLWDERLTTKQAEKILVNEFDLSRAKRKNVRDSVAACLFLQSYLDSKSSRNS